MAKLKGAFVIQRYKLQGTEMSYLTCPNYLK